MSVTETRLVSWKEIARYLNRDARSVQRWETERSLPVHRLPGGKKGGVFAYPAELDNWLAQEQSTVSDGREQVAGSSELLGDEAVRSGDADPGYAAADTDLGHSAEQRTSRLASRALRLPLAGIIILTITGCAFVVAYFLGEHNAYRRGYQNGSRRQEQVRRLTFQQGRIGGARFRPDGRNVVYSASWQGDPSELFEASLDVTESSRLNLKGAQLLSLSSRSTLAILLETDEQSPTHPVGTLAVRDLYGGNPETIASNVTCADWSPDGHALAYVVLEGMKSVVEQFDLARHEARRIYSTEGEWEGWINHIKFSPDGRRLALQMREDTATAPAKARGRIIIVSAGDGKQIVESRLYNSVSGLAWIPSGDEIWFAAAEQGISRGLHALDMHGGERLVYQSPATLTLQDIAQNGDVLVTRDSSRFSLFIERTDSESGSDLSLYDGSVLGDFSQDGKKLVIAEVGDAVREPRLYIRSTAGSAAMRLGNASTPVSLSNTGDLVLAATNETCPRAVMFTPGKPSRILTPPNLCISTIMWLPDNTRFIYSASQKAGEVRCYVQSLSEATPKPFTPEGYVCRLISPDGRFALAGKGIGPLGNLYSKIATDGSEPPQQVLQMDHGFTFVRWKSSNEIVTAHDGNPLTLKTFNLKAGTVSINSLQRPSGIDALASLMMSADGSSYAIGGPHLSSELYLIQGLR
jgi:Tol biopolymer transport system component